MGSEDLLLRLFKSEFFDEFLALRYLHKKTGGAHEYLCNRLFHTSEDALEKILSPLCDLAVRASGPDPALQRTLIGLSKRSTNLAVKINWILSSVGGENASTSCNAASQVLIDACHAAANSSPAGQGEARSCACHACTSCTRLFSGPPTDVEAATHVASTHVASTDCAEEQSPGHAQTLPTSTSSPRLQVLKDELGKGEGVSALIEASRLNLQAGGNGVVARSFSGTRNGVCSVKPDTTQLNDYEATLRFFEHLCTCGQGLIKVPSDRRHSVLRQRLENCNEALFSREMMSKVLWPMGKSDERIIRLVPDQLILLHSRERTPFLLFVETMRPRDIHEEHGMQSRDDCVTYRTMHAEDHLVPPPMKGHSNMCVDESGDGGWVHVPQYGPGRVTQSASVFQPESVDIAVHADRLSSMSKDDYIRSVHGGSHAEVLRHIQEISPFGRCHGWNCHAVIVKSGDDCRQELLAMQLINAFQRAFDAESLPLWLKPYQVLPVSNRSALIQLVPDCTSVHSIKKKLAPGHTLAHHFFRMFPAGSIECEAAQRSFAQSLAAYSLVCYLLQVKDRHNANILLDRQGHIIHIDFGFMLSNSPGGVSFERAPFKLTAEYMAILGSDINGSPSPSFQYFKNMWCAGFAAATKHSESIIELIEIMQDSQLPCFGSGRKTLDNVKKRFKADQECVLSLLLASIDAWTTRQYDYYQRILNGIV